MLAIEAEAHNPGISDISANAARIPAALRHGKDLPEIPVLYAMASRI